MSHLHVTQKLQGLCEYCANRTIALLMEMIPTRFELNVSYNWQALALKLST